MNRLDMLTKMFMDAGIKNSGTATALSHLLAYGTGLIRDIPREEKIKWVKLGVIDKKGRILISDNTIKALKSGYLTTEWVLLGLVWEGKVKRVPKNKNK